MEPFKEDVLSVLKQILTEIKEMKEQRVVNNTTLTTQNITASEDFFKNLDSLVRTNKN